MFPLLMNLLAQNPSPCVPGDMSWRTWLIPLIVVAVGYFLIIGRMRKKQQQKREDELGGLKKNARIMTIGGIYGTVVQVKEEDKKVVIKIDETTNTRMTISRSAVRNVLSGKEEDDEKETK